MLDGNAVAGLLQGVRGRDDDSIGTCGDCGATDAVGAMHVYRGAGIVMRCPHCDNALVRISKTTHACGSGSKESARCRSLSRQTGKYTSCPHGRDGQPRLAGLVASPNAVRL